jgi:hypothetical protein
VYIRRPSRIWGPAASLVVLQPTKVPNQRHNFDLAHVFVECYVDRSRDRHKILVCTACSACDIAARSCAMHPNSDVEA